MIAKSDRVRRLAALSFSEMLVLLACSFGLTAMSLALRWMPTRRVLAWAQRPRVHARRSPVHSLALSRLVYLIDVAARHLPVRANCLAKSLLLSRHMSKRDLPYELVIGVRLIGHALSAHAWIEFDGIPVNDTLAVTGQFHRITGRLPSYMTFDER